LDFSESFFELIADSYLVSFHSLFFLSIGFVYFATVAVWLQTIGILHPITFAIQISNHSTLSH